MCANRLAFVDDRRASYHRATHKSLGFTQCLSVSVVNSGVTLDGVAFVVEVSIYIQGLADKSEASPRVAP